VEKENVIEAYVTFDSFADKNLFDPSTASILNKFREHAVSAISKVQTLKTLQEKNKEIVKTHEQLIIQEKLASLGTLTAGIAHEIKNPLNFVNNFAEISLELVDELKEKLESNKILLKKETIEEISDIIANLEEIVTKINTHGNRADGIVKSMLLHSRASSGERSLVDINELLDQYLNLVYHGFRAKDKSFNVTIEKEYDQTLEKINIIPQDISRVFLNLLNNACYATNERKQKENETFQPRLKVETINQDGKVEIRIRDNGTGIPEKIKKNLFNPFFTTKPAGEGTGLGLSLSYDIVVKEHGGKLEFYSEENNFTEFLIVLPKK
jgi:signal transduction histidine kinase